MVEGRPPEPPYGALRDTREDRVGPLPEERRERPERAVGREERDGPGRGEEAEDAPGRRRRSDARRCARGRARRAGGGVHERLEDERGAYGRGLPEQH